LSAPLSDAEVATIRKPRNWYRYTPLERRCAFTIDSLRQRVEELERLLLDIGGYVGSDVFIRASNAHDCDVERDQLQTEVQRLRGEVERLTLIETKAAGLVRTAHPEVGKREVVRQWWDSLVAALHPPVGEPE
jgi:hypothetical protein